MTNFFLLPFSHQDFQFRSKYKSDLFFFKDVLMVNLNLFVAVCTRVDTWWFLFPVKRWVEAAWNSWLYDPLLDNLFWNELNGDLLCQSCFSSVRELKAFKLYFSACHCFFGESGRMCLFFDKDTKLFYHIDSLLKSCLITLFVLYSVSHNHGCSFDLARNSHGI